MLNTLNAEIAERSLKVIKNGGTIISIASSFSDELKQKAASKNIKTTAYVVASKDGELNTNTTMQANTQTLTQISVILIPRPANC